MDELSVSDLENFEYLAFPSSKLPASWENSDKKYRHAMSRRGMRSRENFICIHRNIGNSGQRYQGRYVSMNLETNQMTEMYSHDQTNASQFLTHVTEDEFLIAGPSSLGIIADAHGSSRRQPLQFSPNVLSVFVWGNYVFAVTDEFLTIHNVMNQVQIQTVPLSNATVACFTTTSPVSSVVVSMAENNEKQLMVVGPERWDHFARKLFSADCITQAKRLFSNERSRMEASNSNTTMQHLFSMRARRFYTLTGLYHFEKGEFSEAEWYLENSLLDIRELLIRYTDLLPKGYHFEPDVFFNRNAPSPDSGQPDILVSVAELCLIHASRVKDQKLEAQSHDQWALRYDCFLFAFLQKHRLNKRMEKYSHLIETALIKLHVRIAQRGQQPDVNEFFSSSSGRWQPLTTADPTSANNRLVNLIFSLVHVDVEDLIGFLQTAQAPHTLALVYLWHGMIAEALNVWQKLAYSETHDSAFPGVDFYVDVLLCLLPTEKQPPSTHLSSTPGVYTELIWRHLCTALLSGDSLHIAERLLFALAPHLPLGNDCLQVDLSTEVIGLDVNDLKSHDDGSCANVSTVMQKLTSMDAGDLALRFLSYLVYNGRETVPAHHDQLARMYLHSIKSCLPIGSSTPADGKLLKLRKEFCQFIRWSSSYSVDNLLANMQELGEINMPHEIAILLGKKGDHRAAIRLLLSRFPGFSTAWRYCISFTQPPNVICPASTVSLSGEVDVPTFQQSFNVQPGDTSAFTAFIELLLTEGDAKSRRSAMNLINSTDIPLDFAKILSILPANLPLRDVSLFLKRAMRCTRVQMGSVRRHCDLSEHDAILSVLSLPHASSSPPYSCSIQVESETACNRCKQRLSYDSIDSFAWQIKTKQLVHVHCLVRDEEGQLR